MVSYIELTSQIEKLQKQAESVKRRELNETISKIRKAIKAFGLTAEDLGFGNIASKTGRGKKTKFTSLNPTTSGFRGNAKRAPNVRKKPSKNGDRRSVVAPKFRDPATGAQWSGRGKQPRWLSLAIANGKKLEDFSI